MSTTLTLDLLKLQGALRPHDVYAALVLKNDEHAHILGIHGYLVNRNGQDRLYTIKYPYSDGSYFAIPGKFISGAAIPWADVPAELKQAIVNYWLKNSVLIMSDLVRLFPEIGQ